MWLWRLKRGLTQDRLARRARIPRPNLSRIEQGGREVSLRTLRALAAALDIRPGLLVDGIPPPGSGVPAALSRQALERVADRVVSGKPLRSPEERKLADGVGHMIRPRALAAGRRLGAKPIRGRRMKDAAWLELTASYPPEIVRSLVQRITDRLRLP